MRRQVPSPATFSHTRLITGLLLAVGLAGLIVFLLLSDKEPAPATLQVKPAPEPKGLTQSAPVTKAVEKSVPDKLTSAATDPTPPKPKRPASTPDKDHHAFVIQGRLSTGGEPWAANMILVKILWLKNRDGKQFLLGKETGVVQATSKGFAYRIVLKPQSREFLNWNSGVEGNVGRVVAFVDHKRDGRLSLHKDKIIAVSKELIRYRTGRYDQNRLNPIQRQNIVQAGKGYAIVRNIQGAENKADWKVMARNSPTRLDLNASETSLPHMYNTFIKLQ